MSGKGHNKFKTHCKRGHVFDEQNTRRVTVNGRQYRSCKKCSAFTHRRNAVSGANERIAISKWLESIGHKTLAKKVFEGVHRDFLREIRMGAVG